MRPRIIDRDRGWKRVMKELGKRNPPPVKVGIQGSEAAEAHADTGLSIAEIMSRHEFGLMVPRRSWLRDWFDERVKEAEKTAGKIAGSIVDGRFTLDQGLNQLGSFLVGDLQKRWARGIPPPNHPITIDKKGSDTPLIDTGQSRGAVTYQVGK